MRGGLLTIWATDFTPTSNRADMKGISPPSDGSCRELGAAVIRRMKASKDEPSLDEIEEMALSRDSRSSKEDAMTPRRVSSGKRSRVS